MPKCTLIFLFDSGQVCEESWDLGDSQAEPLMARLRRVAQARLALLASSLRIVQLRAIGHPTERVDLRGIGGAFAWPRDGLRVINDMRTSGTITLRGVPKEVFSGRELTPIGRVALANFSKTLGECGCSILRHGESRGIADLHATGKTLFNYKKDKKAPLYKLKSILGEEKAIQVWDELKERREK